MANPFFNRGPIQDPRFFFPRARETREVARLAAGTQNCSVVGPVKSGKTSLLLHLARPGTLTEYGLPAGQRSVVYLSFEGLGTLSPEQFFHLLLRETARQTSGKIAVVWPRLASRDALSFLEFRDALDQLEVAGESLIFLLDEVELAAENPSFDLNFFSALRHVAARPHVCFATATEARLHELKVAGREIGSPFADLFSVVVLHPLDSDASWRAVRELALDEGVDLAPEREFILQLGGGYAYHLQVVAYEVFESKAPEAVLTDEQRAYVASRAYEQVEPILTIMWDRLRPDAREAALTAAADGNPVIEIEGLTSVEDGRARPINGLVARFLSERQRDRGAQVRDFLEASVSPDRQMMYSAVRVLTRAVEARDEYARDHADRVTRLAAAIAKELGCSDESVEGIRIAARVHDIGRVSISDIVLLKPGPLTELETEIVRTHPVVGAQILDALEFPWSVKPAVRYHHERLDGSGYPEGLMGDEIPFGARVIAVADVMAAMTSDRPYRRAFAPEEALQELTQNAGVKYDQAAVAALERITQKGLV